MTDTTFMRTWAEIDLDALDHNYKTLRGETEAGCRFLGLCKANAYGHGAAHIGPELQRLGAEMLAVACVDEAVELRRAGVTIPVLCLGQVPAQLAPMLAEYHVTQMVEDLDTGRALSAAAVAAGCEITVHVKIDTGMSRLGFLWRQGEDNSRVLDDIAALLALPGIRGEGLFTHLANADGDEDYTMAQFTRFLEARDALKARGIEFEICHCASSAAVLKYPCTHLDMIRPGLALYGFSPMGEDDEPELKPVLTLKSRVAAVRALPKGTPVSYGCTQMLRRDSRLAVVPIGYGDGFPRLLSNRMELIVHGIPCPIVGRICMDMCMIDVTDVPDVKTGDEVLVYGPGQTERAAQAIGTIVYELLCDLTGRVPRVYVDGPEA